MTYETALEIIAQARKTGTFKMSTEERARFDEACRVRNETDPRFIQAVAQGAALAKAHHKRKGL